MSAATLAIVTAGLAPKPAAQAQPVLLAAVGEYAHPITLAVAGILFAGLAAYAVFAGADFGGGIWDLLAGGTQRGRGPRALIDESITPVWEANHVWLILGLVVLWTAFPPAFASIMTTMFVPLNLSLLGIFFRGVGFAYRHEARSVRAKQLYGAMFAGSSLITPFFLGTVVGAIITGGVRVGATGNQLFAWTSPTALLIGGFALSACAYIGAVYLLHDADQRNQPELVRYFRPRAAAAGILTGLLAAASLGALSVSTPYIYHQLLGRAFPLTGLSAAAGAAALVLIALGRVKGVRELGAVAVVTAIWGWAAAQYPWLLTHSLTLRDGSAPFGTMVAELVTIAMVGVFVVPGFVTLYYLQQRGELEETSTSEDLRSAAAAQNVPERPGRGEGPPTQDRGARTGAGHAPPGVPGERLVTTVLATTVTVGAVRRLVRRVRRWRRWGPP